MVNENHPESPMCLCNSRQICSFPCTSNEALVPEAFKEHDPCAQALLEKITTVLKSLKHPLFFNQAEKPFTTL